MNKYGFSRSWVTEANIKGFKSGALRTNTNITRTGFELSVSQYRNAIDFCIIAIPKKFHFTMYKYKTLCKTQKNM